MRSKKNIRFENGKRIYIRDDIESQMIQNNGCTNPIRIHPIVGTNMFFKRDKLQQTQDGLQTDYHISLIYFDGRQWWKCLYYDIGTHGWECERDNVVLRLTEADFIRLFGKIKVVGNGIHRYYEECENDY